MRAAMAIARERALHRDELGAFAENCADLQAVICIRFHLQEASLIKMHCLSFYTP